MNRVNGGVIYFCFELLTCTGCCFNQHLFFFFAENTIAAKADTSAEIIKPVGADVPVEG